MVIPVQAMKAREQDWPRMILALDLDGTLLTEQETVSTTNIAALQFARANGIQPTIVTGRMWHHRVSTLTRELGIRLPVAALNGGVIFSPEGELLQSFPISADDVDWLCTKGELAGLDYAVCTIDRIVRGVETRQLQAAETVISATFHTTRPEQMLAFREELEQANRFNLTWPDDYHIVVNAKGINKATALEFLCEKYDLTSDHIAAIGDGINDFEMLAFASHSFAMGNALDALKSVAKETTSNCDEDGVARAVHRLVDFVTPGNLSP